LVPVGESDRDETRGTAAIRVQIRAHGTAEISTPGGTDPARGAVPSGLANQRVADLHYITPVSNVASIFKLGFSIPQLADPADARRGQRVPHAGCSSRAVRLT
jgi:hypothetical protein